VNPNIVLPFCSSLLSFVFAVMVGDQWLRRRQPYQLVWTIGLLWYGISAGTEFVGGFFGWSEPLYRIWYLIGAYGVAAYLGLGTIFLLNRTRFGYFVAFSLFLAGLFSWLTTIKYADQGEPVSTGVTLAVLAFTWGGALLLVAVTALARHWVAPVSAALLVAASAVAVVLVITVQLQPPGYALDSVTSVPIGQAFPSDLRILTPPFNITGAFALVFGAVYSAYIFMPKTRLLRGNIPIPVVGAVWRAIAVTVNFFASIPAAIRALGNGTLNSRVPATVLIALGGFIPGWTSGLNRFGVTWSFFLGEFLGVLFIFLGFLVSIEVFTDVRLPFTHVVLLRRRQAAAGEATAAGGAAD
jgi:hypothetical protein